MSVVPSDPAALGDEIARTAAHLDAATHRLLTCIRAFDVSEEWHRQGAISCAHWLAWRINLDPATAREKVRVARALGILPGLDDALRRGVLSYAKVRALTRVATPENEGRLLTIAENLTGAQLERVCRGLRRAVALTADGARLHEHRTVRDEILTNGMVRLTITLHPDEAALVMKAIEHARLPDAPAQPRRSESPAPLPDQSTHPSAETRQSVSPKADALVKVAEAYLAHAGTSARSAGCTQIFVHLDQDGGSAPDRREAMIAP
jgi:Domain of unknown function (DUF222)